MSSIRGKVTKIVFSIEYPDGSTKESTVFPIRSIEAVMMSDDFMSEEMKSLFNRSDTDWKKNPAMVIVDGGTLKANCDYPDCQNA
jgi:hypothetical protein